MVGGCNKVKCGSLNLIQQAGNSCCNSVRLSSQKPVKRTIDIPTGTGPCKGLTGTILAACNARQVKKENVKKQSENKQDKEKGGGKAVQAGPNKETIDSILGSSEDWRNAVDEQMKNCFGIGIPCQTLAIAVGAGIVLLLVLK
jgi:hypothetical protein